MPVARANIKYIRISPRKLRLLADHLRQQELDHSLSRLQLARQKAAYYLIKALKQARANAQTVGLTPPFKISKLLVNPGPRYKRWRAVSRGMAHGYVRPTSHIYVEVESISIAKPTAQPQAKTKAKPTSQAVKTAKQAVSKSNQAKSGTKSKVQKTAARNNTSAKSKTAQKRTQTTKSTKKLSKKS